MANGLDPRKDPAPLAEVPRLLRGGAVEFNARRFWHAHEAWETAWHALRAHQPEAAGYVRGMILVAAALGNWSRSWQSLVADGRAGEFEERRLA